MRIILAIIISILALNANADIADLRDESMRRLVVYATPRDVPQTPFFTDDGGEKTLAEYRGKIVVLNFWATWCPPCRKEMPSLSALQAKYGGDDFEVVTIAVNEPRIAKARQFFEDIGVDNLPLYRDDNTRLSAQMGVFGLPVTVILNREGQEIASLQGDADWFSNSAQMIVEELISNH